MLNLILAGHIVIALIIIGLILLQHGKGADMGASFGGGSSKSVFGSRGAAPFLMKVTGLFAAIFFATSLYLGHLAKSYVSEENSLTVPAEQTGQQAPAGTARQQAPQQSGGKQPAQQGSKPLDQIKQQSTASASEAQQQQSAAGTPGEADKGSENKSSSSPLEQIQSQ